MIEIDLIVYPMTHWLMGKDLRHLPDLLLVFIVCSWMRAHVYLEEQGYGS